VHTHVLKTLAAAFLVIAVSLSSSSASAQSSSKTDPIDTQAAGVVGLGLLGAEVGLLIPPLAKLHNHWWAWALFPTIGAGAGVGVGIATLDGVDNGVNIALVATGMGLIIPAVVGALALRSWRSNQPYETIEQTGAVRLGRVQFDAPSVSTRQIYTTAEQNRLGLRQRTALSLSLLSGRF
jgi:hypothetical protein